MEREDQEILAALGDREALVLMDLMDLMDLMVMVEKGGLAGVVEEVGGLEAQEVMADKANTEALHLEIPGCLEVRVTRVGARNCPE